MVSLESPPKSYKDDVFETFKTEAVKTVSSDPPLPNPPKQKLLVIVKTKLVLVCTQSGKQREGLTWTNRQDEIGKRLAGHFPIQLVGWSDLNFSRFPTRGQNRLTLLDGDC